MTITHLVISAIILGLTAALSPGPLLTLLLAETIRSGVKAGFKIAISPLITDAPIIIVIWRLSIHLAEFTRIGGVIAIIGSIYLFYLGCETLLVTAVRMPSSSSSSSIKKGILVNLLNPHPYLFWFTVGVPLLIHSHSIHKLLPALFLLIFYIFLIGIKILIVFVISRVRNLLDSTLYLLIIRILGIILLAFAIIFLRYGIKSIF